MDDSHDKVLRTLKIMFAFNMIMALYVVAIYSFFTYVPIGISLLLLLFPAMFTLFYVADVIVYFNEHKERDNAKTRLHYYEKEPYNNYDTPDDDVEDYANDDPVEVYRDEK